MTRKNKQLKEVDERLEEFEDTLETKERVSKIAKRLDGFAAIEHIDAL